MVIRCAKRPQDVSTTIHVSGIRSFAGALVARLCVRPIISFHAKAPLVALFELVHLGVTITDLVLGRVGRSNQLGVHYGVRLEQQAVSGQLGADDLQNL